MDFAAVFERATGFVPMPWQRRLAERGSAVDVVDIPTGLGKTAGVVMAWLWQRRFAPSAIRAQTPRRLVFCLPMRVLVEQTATAVRQWVSRAGLDGADGVGAHTLLGGDLDDRWLDKPEADSVLIGTQDMLLSRALNRGYGMSRYLWPMACGLVNNDARWVFDEVQLMGAGLGTSAQLQGLADRWRTFGPRQSVWASATVTGGGLNTVDHPTPNGGWRLHQLGAEDERHPVVRRRLDAAKSLKLWPVGEAADAVVPPRQLAAAVLEQHVDGSLTLVVLNRVARAQEVYRALLAAGRTVDNTALIHGRFRPLDRRRHEHVAGLRGGAGGDRVVVSTQTIEAGVDMSARTLWTELCPWPSLVQRLGRLHRYGEFASTTSSDGASARAFVVRVPLADKAAAPYKAVELCACLDRIGQLAELPEGGRDAGPASLRDISLPMNDEIYALPRARDLLGLFDTTSDLSGDDLDVSRFIRDGDDNDVQLYWRPLTADSDSLRPADDEPEPARDELCRAPIGAVAAWLKKSGKRRLQVWQPAFIPGGRRRDRQWERATRIVPGRLYLVDAEAGGYDPHLGWLGPAAKHPVLHVKTVTSGPSGDGQRLGDDPRSAVGRWVSLRQHSADAANEARHLVERLAAPLGIDHELARAICVAAHWHDVGKAHPAFQRMLGAPPAAGLWAKSAHGRGGHYSVLAEDGETAVPRAGFRHELASALAWLAQHPEVAHSDLVGFLVAAHHGKVRASIRSLPRESTPPDGTRAARGVWDGDHLPTVQLGRADASAAITLDLAVMELGGGGIQHSWSAGRSWATRIAELLEQWGPFRLTWLETLVRVADWRASRRAAAEDESPTPAQDDRGGVQ